MSLLRLSMFFFCNIMGDGIIMSMFILYHNFFKEIIKE